MKNISRRLFIRKSSFIAGTAIAFSQLPASLFANAATADISVGFQIYPLRDEIPNGFDKVLKDMSAQGYSIVEMCSPKGYGGGFEPLISMKTAEIKKVINDAGLTCPSCHFAALELNNELDDRIQFAKELGLEHMVCSSFGLPKTARLDDYLAAADKLNQAGEKIKQAGMQAGFHNHSGEFATLDGQLIYEALMKRLDPDLVKMQFQTEVINLGYKASTYFNKYPGRFISGHLSDWTADKKQVPIGKGIIDWKEFFKTAKTGGVKYFFVEMDPETFKDSIAYIKQIN